MLPYLNGQKVFSYVDGTLKQPPQELRAIDGTTSPNPLFETWEIQNNLILSCINASFIDEVLVQVVHCTSSHAVWTALISTFASQSRAQAIHVRSQLFNACKTTQMASEYFMQIKRIADDLAFAEQPLRCDDIIRYILASLGPEYDSLITTVSARDNSLPLEEVYSMLLNCEARIRHHSQTFNLANPSVHVAAKSSNFTSSRGCGSPTFRGNGRGHGSSRDWHRRLGHASFRTVNHVLHANKLHVGSNKRQRTNSCSNDPLPTSFDLNTSTWVLDTEIPDVTTTPAKPATCASDLADHPSIPPNQPAAPRCMITRSQTNNLKPRQPFVGMVKYHLPKCLISKYNSPLTEPTSFTEASKHASWRDAMNSGFNALLKNGTWDLVPPKLHQNLVGNKWVYRIKTLANGHIE
ncbi:hypothetical protein F2P56_032953 [Juglans regia]|uniref:Uncharacterized protein n=2 Tax=Juglans regia TaxID=51240 RepID=A0A833WFN3_JUGRE|nr:uncharacterized protein LOC108988264 [Juglans regia]KAF5447398.1 hypothetical protein F2P56_032953 [Juglans regia]